MRLILTAALLGVSALSFAQTDSSEFFLQKGLEEKGKGRLMESYKAFDKAYTYNKNNKQVVSLLASSLFDLRRYPQSREKYMELEKMGDKSATTYKQLMNLSFNLRQFDDATKYANLLKQADPSQKVYFFIGKASYDQENYGQALKYLNMAAQEEPQNAEIPYLIARSYADMMNYKQAMPYFEKAISMQPDNARWMYETGLMYYGNHDDKNSLKYLLMAGEKGYKKDNEYLENLAIAYLNTGNTDKGLGILTEALSRRPTDMNLLNMIAEANYDAKRYEKAIEYWDQVLGMDKQNASALYMIGMSYQKKGEKQKGQQLCDKAIEMDPSLARNKQKMSMPGGL
ncbi:MAG TPA: tetratricopeptide repeat protein [Chitinophagaceae bacterium]